MKNIIKDKRGFTLVELMITVATISILAAIAVPNFIAYRDKSRISSCLATCESLRCCQAGYAADHDDYYYIFRVARVSSSLTGCQIEIRPSGLMKQTY